jgi:tetratricopeptide (TPR) repeat protein
MIFLELEQAVNQIKNACRSSSDPPTQQRKFFFIIGAGVSLPSVPLARAITAHCKQEAERKGSQSHQAEKTTSEDYSYWLQEAYPQRSDRQRYLRELIEGKPISHANLRLAHLLLDPEIANLVVTTNFDDFLSRALTLFGKPHVVCDHPNTTERIDPERQDVQIVHVHGSYWFYDCCNLTDEIAQRSERSHQRNQTMASLLDRILFNRSPIVVGYRGWENDVIMQALKRRLNSELPNDLYWFLYKRPNAGESPVPDWLWKHSDVKFVAPREIEAAFTSSDKLQMTNLEKGNDPKSPALDAQKVFSAMIQSLGLEPPLLTKDPLQHFKEHLENSLPQDAGGKQDPYGLQAVVAKIERAKEKEQRQQPDLLEPIRNALRKAHYREAAQLAQKIPLNSLEDDLQRQELIGVLQNVTSGLFDYSVEELLTYKLIVDVYDALSPTLQEALADIVAVALINQGITLGNLNHPKEEIKVYDNLIEHFGSYSETTFQKLIALALFNKGTALGKLNRPKEEIKVYDDLIGRFNAHSEPSIQEAVIKALGNKGVALGNLNYPKKEIAVYDDLIKRFNTRSDSFIQEAVAKALFNKGVALGNRNRQEEEIAAYNQLIERFGTNLESALQALVAKALVYKGIALRNLKRLEEAILIYDAVVERFGKSTELALQEEVADAFGNRGFTLLCQAKKAWSQDTTKAKVLLATAQENTLFALDRFPEDSIYLRNLGYIEFLLGNGDKARSLLIKAIRLGGETIRQNALEDSQLDPVPQDETFRELINSLKVIE